MDTLHSNGRDAALLINQSLAAGRRPSGISVAHLIFLPVAGARRNSETPEGHHTTTRQGFIPCKRTPTTLSSSIRTASSSPLKPVNRAIVSFARRTSPLPSDNQTTPTPSDCWQLTTKGRCCRYRRKAEALRILRRHCEPNPGSGLGSPVQYDGCYIQDQHTADKQEHDVQIFREHCRVPQMRRFQRGMQLLIPSAHPLANCDSAEL